MAREKETTVLDHARIGKIIARFAHEIYERHPKLDRVFLVGIQGRGSELAERIAKHLRPITKMDVRIEELSLDKTAPLEHPIALSCPEDDLAGETVILIDDVLNSGLTLVHGLRHILGTKVYCINTVVLVDRIHRRYPIKADIVGLTLSTTLQDRVEVTFGKRDYAYLT